MKFKKLLIYEIIIPLIGLFLTFPIPLMALFFFLNLCLTLANYLTYEIEVSEDKVILKSGIINRKEEKILFNKIQKTSKEQNIIQMIFKIGTIKLETGNDLVFSLKNIKGHTDLLSLVESKISQKGS